MPSMRHGSSFFSKKNTAGHDHLRDTSTFGWNDYSSRSSCAEFHLAHVLILLMPLHEAFHRSMQSVKSWCCSSSSI